MSMTEETKTAKLESAGDSSDVDNGNCSSSGSGGDTKKTCVDCGTNRTPLWRGGPAGPKSLCNACGIKSRKKRQAALGIRQEDNKIKNKSNDNLVLENRNVKIVRGVSENVKIVRGVSENVKIVRGVSENVKIVRGVSENVKIVRGVSENVKMVRGDSGNVKMVRGDSGNVKNKIKATDPESYSSSGNKKNVKRVSRFLDLGFKVPAMKRSAVEKKRLWRKLGEEERAAVLLMTLSCG